MKIQQHPRMKDVQVGDDVWSYGLQLQAEVIAVFPAAVCVRLVRVLPTLQGVHLVAAPHLWRADEIENVSVCCHCGSRHEIAPVLDSPFRACATCRSVQPSLVIGATHDHVSS